MVYPNPTNDGQIVIDLPQNTTGHAAEINIIDLNGKVVLKENISNTNEPIDLNLGAQLSNGVYQIRVNTAEASYSQRVVLQR
jgi:hypothetical protein